MAGGKILHLPNGQMLAPKDEASDVEVAAMPIPERIAAIHKVIESARRQSGEIRMMGIIMAIGALSETMLAGFQELGAALNEQAGAIEAIQGIATNKRGPFRGRGGADAE